MSVALPKYSDDRYAAQRRAGFPWLKFMPELEQDYRETYIPLNAARLRLAHWVAIASVLGFIVLDVLLGLKLLPASALIVMLAITVPSLAIPIVATYFHDPGATIQRFIFLCGLVLGLSLTVVVELSRMSKPWFPYEALILVEMYIYLVSGLLFFQAATVGMAIWIAFMAAELLWGADVRSSLLYEIYYLLVANVIGMIGLYAMQYDSRKAFLMQNELKQEAMLDSLTGLLNRREFRRHFEAAWLQARREHASIGLLMLDIDNFKTINDTHGHLVGDVALKRVGEVLRSYTHRPLDLIGRFGGDEFIAMWFGVDAAWFSKLAVELPVRFASAAEVGLSGDVHFSVSGGAVLAWPGGKLTPQDAVAAADHKLYEMKRLQSGRIEFSELKAEPLGA